MEANRQAGTNCEIMNDADKCELSDLGKGVPGCNELVIRRLPQTTNILTMICKI